MKKMLLPVLLMFLCPGLEAFKIPFWGNIYVPPLKKIIYTCLFNQEYTPEEIKQKLREAECLPPAHENIQLIVQELCKHVDMDFFQIKVVYNNYHMDGSPAGAFYNYILVNDDFMALPYKQQRAVLAHELMHIKNNDVPDRYKKFIQISIAAHIAHWIYASGVVAYLFSREDDNTVKAMLFAALEVVTFAYLHLAMHGSYAQFQERSADFEAAKIENVAAGLQDWLKHQLMAHGDYPLLLRPLAEHPTHSVRIAYLQQILNEQSATSLT